MIEVYTSKRRYGKVITVVDNVSQEMDPEEIAKKLKKNLACGGTYKDGKIELQGDHLRKMEDLLVKLGFPENKVKIKK